MKRLAIALLLVSPAARADDLDTLYACHPPSATTKIRATFKPETSLADLATWIMGLTCKNVIFSADVAKHATKVTVMAPNDLTPKQAMQLFVDAVDATGLVVVQKGDTIVIKLGPKMPASCPDVAPPPTLASAEDENDGWLDGAIKKIDDTHVEITSAAIGKMLENPMTTAKSARIVPAVKEGKAVGFKLYAIRPYSVWSRAGFLNGDTLLAINGFELTSADKALEIYTKIRDAKSITVDLERSGKRLKLLITVK
jgi:general secretion pathway protein C